MNRTKSIDWSYPTSTNALHAGFYATGCWTLSVSTDGKPPVAIASSAHRETVLEKADAMPEPWSFAYAYCSANRI